MRTWRARLSLAILAAGAVGVAVAGSVGAANAKVLYTSRLYGNIPNVTVRGVKAGAAPWIVQGSAQVTSDALIVQGTDLVVPPGDMADGKPVPKALVGTTVGIPKVAAELTCGQGTSVLTPAVTLTKQGAFKIDAQVKVPAACTDPIVLVGPVANGAMKAWFASTNFLVYGLPGRSALGWGGTAAGSSSGSGSKSTWGG
ncbi:MAG: hypothetical protein K6V73_02675 [Firmicutes bacterium]|nr:hypothetical protein [Bacillota bacterium]